MDIYTTITFITVIIAICYLARLYAQFNGFERDKTLLKEIGNAIADIRLSLWNIEKKIKDEQSTPTED